MCRNVAYKLTSIMITQTRGKRKAITEKAGQQPQTAVPGAQTLMPPVGGTSKEYKLH